MRTSSAVLVAIALSGGNFARAQQIKFPDTPEVLHLAPASDRFPARWYPGRGDGTLVLPAPVTDHPFSADCGPIARKTSPPSACFHARDRDGRVRDEAESGEEVRDGQEVRIKTVTISDPVAHCDFHWQESVTGVNLPPDERVALVTCRPQTLRYKNVDLLALVDVSIPDGTMKNGDTTTTTEHLAPITVGGLTMHRLRVTNIRPDASGKPISFTSETWTSPELREIMRLGNEQQGYTGLSNIRLKDPDPKLFFPPEDYRIEVQPPSR